ncbi:DUF3592 domain-containing protein [Deinococcus hopiensis]|uniref:DUF3592 domain-containing protein n=1 Tax=Deinococcus hopiensis KR-140 TaxID=695939 RepID=A0A1W1UAW2_9DEIO|nr:DUF3592 domain-containing protein [Deinococcus hopiensis]SMB78225.1 Protein of unknown function [Deinococcus hopiensis KR-140]
MPALYDVTRGSSWASVPGVVLSSAVETRMVQESDAYGWSSAKYFEPRVTYRYEVDGVSRVGHHLMAHSAASRDQQWAWTQRAQYRVGAAVPVYVSPDRTQSVLVPGLGTQVWRWLLLPAALLLLGAGRFWAGQVGSGAQSRH